MPRSRLGGLQGRRGARWFLPPEGPAPQLHKGLQRPGHGVGRQGAHHKAPPRAGQPPQAANAGVHRQPQPPPRPRPIGARGRGGRLRLRLGPTRAAHYRPPHDPTRPHQRLPAARPAAAGPPPHLRAERDGSGRRRCTTGRPGGREAPHATACSAARQIYPARSLPRREAGQPVRERRPLRSDASWPEWEKRRADS